VQNVSLFLPATYLVQGLRRAIFESAPIWDRNVLISLGSLVCWAALTFFLSAQLFRWEPEVKVRRNAKLLVVATAIPFLLLGLWENKFGNIPAQAQSAFDSLNGPQKSAPPPADSPK
jgi:hypothetical protein